ncbi:MAG: YicC family protein [Bacteroidetes bacterium]|nr:YicC family protein [Bacteroidota bacterium]MBS1539342.1 YicC family protein [Bacteroidota bacterium]
MIYSMTGYGQVADNTDKLYITTEVKSLNSKFLDLSLRLPKKFTEKENEVRAFITERLTRGKISVTVELQVKGETLQPHYNEALFLSTYAELKKLADKVMGGYESLFQLALDTPGVQIEIPDAVDANEWDVVFAALKKAVDTCCRFRQEEGKALEKELKTYVATIYDRLRQVEGLDEKRTERVRARLKENISALFGNEGYDANRLEQEMIYYVEKLDIEEERVRLKTHLDYFLSVMGEAASNGKKLAFIAQEIGREINTIGSKANDAEIQKAVVEMKDELEKIKEQLNNVL